MSYKLPKVGIVCIVLFLALSATADQDKKINAKGSAVLWREPDDIEFRNLFYGSGGEEHQPKGTFTFVEEDLEGTNPKFEVRDQDGVRWKVKLGAEARPEVAASRFVWATGYFTNEDYFLDTLKVEGMPVHLHRGQNLLGKDGTVPNARLKRHLKGEEKLGTWRWRSNPFTGTKELNGLRVIMALVNNWDLKDENNAIYNEAHEGGSPEQIYMVSDLGASFGTSGFTLGLDVSRGNIQSYKRSGFITKLSPDQVDFKVPGRPSLIEAFNIAVFVRRSNLEWIGRGIPREDARGIGQLLSHLSRDQIRDAFRAGGYSPKDVDSFAREIQWRIGELNRL
jgi:hypothetical protein